MSYNIPNNTAYGSSWNGDVQAPTKDAVYDKIETLTSGNNIISVTADEALTAGQTVGISNYFTASRVARALRNSSVAAHGIANQTFTGLRNANYCPIGGDKFVYISYSTDTSDTLYAQVGSVDQTTNTMTLGTALAVATAITPVNTALANAAVCKLGTDKFIVFYLADASTTNIQYRVGTVSGTTITYGTAATFVTAGSTVATSIAFNADFISTDKGIFSFKAATGANSKMVAFTVSGTVATPSVTPVTPGTNSQLNNVSYIKTIGTDKYVLITNDTGTPGTWAQVCTLSGTVITAGTEVNMSTTTTAATESAFQVVSPATDVFVVRWLNAGSTVNLVAATVSGTTPTAGTTLTTASGVGAGGIYAISTTKMLVSGSTLSGLLEIGLSGNALTNNGNVVQTITSQSWEGNIYMDNGYCVALTLDATNVTAWMQGMSNMFIGFAQTTVAAGAAVDVLVGGKDANQSGLIIGGLYQANGTGGLTFISSAATVDNPVERFGTAVSTTEIVI